jgi:hypothetical protein
MALLLTAFCGCGDQLGLVPVSGQVLIDGKPVPYGAVRLIPKEGPPAIGRLDSEGRFKLTTDEREGCVKGTHAVEISATEAVSEYQNKEHAPTIYSAAATSGLTATIDGPKDDLVINLTWGKK